MAQRQFKSTDTSVWAEKFGNGSDGVGSINTSTFAEANETFTGTSGATTGTAGGTSLTNNDCVLIWQTYGTGAGNWELNKVTSGGGTANLTFKYALCNTYGSGAQILKLKQYSSLTVNSSQTWTGSEWDGSKGGALAALVNGVITVTGNLVTTGKGYIGGAGVRTDGQASYAGEDGSGAGEQSTAANGISGGGGAKQAGSAGGGGGGGGYGTAGTNGETSGGSGGGTAGPTGGAAALTTLSFGGAGGAGGYNSGANGAGGDGGGVILLIGKTITVTGTMVCDGSVGGEPQDENAGGGGGGAGGSILLKGQTITLGSGLVTAAGALGSTTRADGGNGGNGRIHVDYLTSLSGTTTPTVDSTQDTSLTSDEGGFFFNLI